MTQKQRIAKYLDDFGTITPMEAFHDLGITKLATRISEMKKDGYKFQTEMIHSKDRYGKPTRYAKYSWDKQNEVVMQE